MKEKGEFFYDVNVLEGEVFGVEFWVKVKVENLKLCCLVYLKLDFEVFEFFYLEIKGKGYFICM